jgi:hypothetical protein
MLVAMLPNQISEQWPLYKGHIEDSLPPTADYGNYDTNNILYSLMYGAAQMWTYQENNENKGFVITTIMNDISGIRLLMLYSIVIINPDMKVDWQLELNTLRKYANSRGCSKICAYVMNQKLLDKLKGSEVETRFTFASMNI